MTPRTLGWVTGCRAELGPLTKIGILSLSPFFRMATVWVSGALSAALTLLVSPGRLGEHPGSTASGIAARCRLSEAHASCEER